MINFITSLIIIGLLVTTGFDFSISESIDFFQSESKDNFLPQRIISQSLGIKTTAKNIIIADEESGLELYKKNEQDMVPVASIVKLMTALVILDGNPDWDELITILPQDQIEGGIIYFFSGEQVRLKDLFSLMLIASSNEAAVALARNSGINDFVSAMNKKAREIGMDSTYFSEPSGIESSNISTAADLLKLTKTAFGIEQIANASKLKTYEFNTINTKRKVKAYATNQLLSSFLNSGEYEILSGKTGFINKAGYCLVLRIKKNNSPVITMVVLGSESIEARWQETKGLADWVFSNYEWP